MTHPGKRRHMTSAKKFLATIILGIILLPTWTLLSFGVIRPWFQRCIECPAENVMPFVKKAYNLEFTDNISKVRCAKSGAYDGRIGFIVTFTTDTYSIDKFTGSLQSSSGDLVEFGKYQIDRDKRRDFRGWPASPKWFTRQITEGIMATLYRDQDMYIYIDMSDPAAPVVYLAGHYSKRVEAKT